MASKLMVIGAGISAFAAAYLWQVRREQPVVAAEPLQNPAISAPAPTSAPPLVAALPAPPIDEPPPPRIGAGAEFDAILKKNELAHSKFEAQAVDPYWASSMEQLIAPQYSEREGVTMSSLQCKTTMCEVRLIGKGLSKSELQQKLTTRRTPTPGTPQSAMPSGTQAGSLMFAFDEQDGSTVAVMFMMFGRTE